jgi:hypothetical protein
LGPFTLHADRDELKGGVMLFSKRRKAGLRIFSGFALMLAFEGRAQASYTYHDLMETSSSWSFEGDGSYSGYLSTNYYYSNGGEESARLSAGAGSWSSTALTVPLSATFPCTASFEVRALDVQTFAIEVIDPATWTYVDYSSFYIDSSHLNKWVYLEGNSWSRPAYSNVVVRATVSSASGTRRAYVDDLRVECGF